MPFPATGNLTKVLRPMNFRESQFLHHARAQFRRARRGFALIVTLSLMTLLLILVLALTTLVRLSLGTAQDHLINAQARQNALLAAYIAIGQLQKFAGPDQRVTTTADIGRVNDPNDNSDGTINGGGLNFTQVNSKDSGAASPTPNPYGATSAYTVGGTRYWTAVWGEGTNPLGLYTGQAPDINQALKSTPEPVLLNWLVSGDEGTPLTGNFVNGLLPGNGVVQVPVVAMNFTSDTTAITSKGTPSTLNWTSATNDITIMPNPTSGSTSPQPAVVLVGPNSGETNSNAKLTVSSGPGGPLTTLTAIFLPNNLVVAPVVNITEPAQASAGTVTTGRYAWHVEDEGVKAKYNISNPYAGQLGPNITVNGLNGQLARYSFGTMVRTGIERMLNMSTYANGTASDVSSSTIYSKTAAAALSNVLEPSEMMLIDKNMKGAINQTIPQETMREHYHDITVYSYGVLADALRGGLRYDLTSALEPATASQAVFNDPVNGLNNKTFLPASTTALAAVASTEPNVVAGGGATAVALHNQSDGSLFHGPAAADQAGAAKGAVVNPVGLKWNQLQSFYNIASKNTTGIPVPMQVGNSTVAAITPVILQARLKFAQYSDVNAQQYVGVQPVFVLANPYNFPITDTGGGLDLGYRINTDTGWEWGAAISSRNADRVNPHGSGVGQVLGYDRTQNVANPNIAMTAGYSGTYFFTTSASTPETLVNGTPVPGYYPFLKNPVSFSKFIFPSSGNVNTRYSSVLDQVAFHIPTGIVFQPGEAKVFTLDTTSNVTGSFPVKTPTYGQSPFDTIVAVVGSSAGTLGQIYINPNQVAPVLLANKPYPVGTNYWMMRDTGIHTAADVLQLNPTQTPNLTPGTNTSINLTYPSGGGTNTTVSNVSQIPAYAAAQPWPDAKFGFISTPYSSVACTLELRLDSVSPTISRQTGSTLLVTTGSGVSAPGQNVLTSLINLDLSGDGLTSNLTQTGTKLDLAGPINAQPPQGYRRQYIGTPDTPEGYMPSFLTGYAVAIDLPGLVTPSATTSGIIYSQDPANQAILVSGNFDPGGQGTYRVYSDYNLRAKNTGLPPFANLNTGTTSRNANATIGAGIGSNSMSPASAFINFPPYGRVFNQGPGNDDSSGAQLGDTSFITYGLTGPGSFQTGSVASPGGGLVNYSFDAPWGYSMGQSASFSGNYAPGDQFTVLYNLPQQGIRSCPLKKPPTSTPDW